LHSREFSFLSLSPFYFLWNSSIGLQIGTWGETGGAVYLLGPCFCVRA
jgi:hypothetical protein